MYALILATTLFVNGDLTNSHKVIPLIQQVERPVIEEVLPTWEVAFVGKPTVYIQATKIVSQGDLFLIADDEDEIILAIKKGCFVYARKLRKDEKIP